MMKKGTWLRAFIFRQFLNFWPCIRGTGGTITHLSNDFKSLRVTLPLSWRTRNRVGTIFGGSLYASTDPMYMLMLMEILGKDYVVWDKGAAIRFKRPGTETLYCDFLVRDEQVEEIKERVRVSGEWTFDWPIYYKNEAGQVFAEITKTLYVADKGHYRKKVESRQKNNNLFSV